MWCAAERDRRVVFQEQPWGRPAADACRPPADPALT